MANPDYALESLQAARAAGAKMLILCDTNGGTLPEDIAERVAKVKQALPGAGLGIHCHNDSDVAVANTFAAVYQGAIQVQGTINAIADHPPNADLISIITNLPPH